MLTKLWYMVCDGCGHPGEPMHDTGTDARRWAKSAGWTRGWNMWQQRHVDLCSECSKGTWTCLGACSDTQQKN